MKKKFGLPLPPPPPPHFAKHSGSVIITFLNTDGTKKIDWMQFFEKGKFAIHLEEKLLTFTCFIEWLLM